MFNDMFLKIIDDNAVINNRRKENQQFTDSIKMEIHLYKLDSPLAYAVLARNKFSKSEIRENHDIKAGIVPSPILQTSKNI